MSHEAIALYLQLSLMTALKMAAPILLACLLVGAVVGLLQALTQIQEATIAFVPKLVAAGLALALSAGFMGHALGGLMQESIRLILTP